MDDRRMRESTRHLIAQLRDGLDLLEEDPSAGRVMFREYAELWRGMQVQRPSTAAQVEMNFRWHIYPTFGQRSLGGIRTSEVQAWVKGRAESLSPATVEVIYRYVVAVLRAAVADRIIATSPCVETDASNRTVPLPQVVLDALAAHMATYAPGPDGLVFATEDGQPIRRTRFSDVWRPAVKAAGAPAGTGFHVLRHFYALLLIRYGESVKVVQARLGHSSAAETLDTYSHQWPDNEDRTRAAVDEELGRHSLNQLLRATS
ncbi:MAG: tyrosine-type recombinase/integrase [Acidimicrobiales bacterium]